MVKAKVDNLPDLVRQSELVAPEQLDRALHRIEQEVGAEQLHEPELVAAKLVEFGLITPWQSENLLQGRYKGFFLQRKHYRLLGHLGTGGMSMVYLAEDTSLRRRVAVKVLPKNRLQDSSYLARFRREAQAVAALDHHNIVRAYDIDQEGDTHFLVMEYVEGRDLQALVKEKGPLDYARAADYIRQAAEGLDHAHRAGLIHRDIKPANLLVDLNNVVKVLDLGLARFTGEEHASLTVAYDENVLGTADYLAPEQAIDSHGVDGRADIYSLGCTLCYLLTGHPPYAEGTLPQRLMAHQKSPPPDIRRERPDAPADLLQIYKRMMAKKPSARFQSARDVADALGAWLKAHGDPSDSGVGGVLLRDRPASTGEGSGSGPKPGSSGSRRGPTKQAAALNNKVSIAPQPGPAFRSPALADTNPKLELETVKGPGSAQNRGLAAGSSKKPGVRKPNLKVAQRLDGSPATADSPPPAPDLLKGPLAELLDDTVPLGANVGQPVVLSNEFLRPPRKDEADGIPGWLWTVIGGGVLAIVVLVAILLAL